MAQIRHKPKTLVAIRYQRSLLRTNLSIVCCFKCCFRRPRQGTLNSSLFDRESTESHFFGHDLAPFVAQM